MEFRGNLKDISKDWKSGKWHVTFETGDNPTTEADKLIDKDLTVSAKVYRRKRSLNANAYAWVLMEKIAEATQTDKWTVYLEALKTWSGVFTYVIVRPDAVEAFKEEWRAVVDLGPINVNSQTGEQLQCYFGSSTFDTAEMARFIDGLVTECKQLGIETLPPDELERMKQQWNIEA